jgi:ABC-2 type transport system ATP-binding protein
MITVSGLTKRYGDRTAVDDLTFTVQAGRVTGFVGPNGAGKSTTMPAGSATTACATPTSATPLAWSAPFSMPAACTRGAQRETTFVLWPR